MKHETRQNRTKRSPETVKTVQNDTGRMVQNGTANRISVPIAQAARMLGVDRRTIRRMCDAGSLQSFMTAGGHRRIALADIEAFRNRRRNADTKISPSSVSSPTLQLRKENLEEMRLMIEERKTKAALRELDDAEHEKAELEEATLRAKEEQARREQRERDSERQKQEQLERRQFWVDEQVEFALKSVPPDVAGRFAAEIGLSVEEALQGVGPSRPRPLVERLVRAAVDRVVEPWRREQQRKQDIAAAANVAADPFKVPGLLGYTESQILARERALRAILALPESAMTFDQMVVAGRAAALQVAQEHQEQRERARAQQDRERTQQKREQEIDGYLFNVLPYLNKCDVDFEGEDPYLCAQRIKQAIRPQLIEDASLNFLNAEQRVKALVDEWIDLSERTPEIEN